MKNTAIHVIGHSHTHCIRKAFQERPVTENADVDFLQLHHFKLGQLPGASNLSLKNVDAIRVKRAMREKTKDSTLVALCISGNAASLFGLRSPARPNVKNGKIEIPGNVSEQLEEYMRAYDEWISEIDSWIDKQILIVPPPPPVADNEWILANPGTMKDRFVESGVSDPGYRMAIYQLWISRIRRTAEKFRHPVLDLPEDVVDRDGFLAASHVGTEPSHAGTAYGARILDELIAFAGRPAVSPDEAPTPAPPGRRQAAHPYSQLPDASFWKRGVERIERERMDPVGKVPFVISREARVATAGSCFAQHISKRLKLGGFRFMDMEVKSSGGEIYDFSARYGNIYTARQLLQLFERAHGYFTPLQGHWSQPDGSFCDPFRPRIREGGFPTIAELESDRGDHLAAVREMFRTLDVFVFTLGLTECWISKLDGAAYPLAPGVAGGTFDDSHAFVNFTATEVAADVRAFWEKLRMINPTARMILTVSPVPLAATYADRHILVSNTYSKAALRVAAEEISSTCADIYYFPSYEIITGNYNHGRYYGSDLRSVTEEGVNHVMSVFMRHLTDSDTPGPSPSSGDDEELRKDMALAEAACDEELLDGT